MYVLPVKWPRITSDIPDFQTKLCEHPSSPCSYEMYSSIMRSCLVRILHQAHNVTFLLMVIMFLALQLCNLIFYLSLPPTRQILSAMLAPALLASYSAVGSRLMLNLHAAASQSVVLGTDTGSQHDSARRTDLSSMQIASWFDG